MMPARKRARVTDHASGEFLGVARLAHGRDHDGSNGHHGRRGRPGQGREHHAGKDPCNGQTALEVPDAGDGKADDPLRHAACRHERRGEDEERNCQKGEMPLEGFKQGAGHRGQRAVGIDQQEQGRAEAKGHRDRHPDQHQADDHGKEKNHFHQFSPSVARARASSISSSTSWLATSRSALPCQMRTAACAKRITSKSMDRGRIR